MKRLEGQQESKTQEEACVVWGWMVEAPITWLEAESPHLSYCSWKYYIIESK